MIKITNLLPSNVNAFGFRTVNKCRNFLGKKPLKDYTLLTKIDKTTINEKTKKMLSYSVKNLPEDSVSFSYVKVGKRSDSSFSREIISFFDKSGNKTSIFRENGYNVKKRVYTLLNDFISTTKKIEESVYVKNQPKKKFYPKVYNSIGKWQKKSVEIQNMETYKLTDISGNKKETNKVLTKKIIYDQTEKTETQKIIFTNYPLNHGFQPKSGKKSAIAEVTKQDGNIFLSNVKTEGPLELDLSDEFLLYRFVDPRTEDGAKSLTKQLLKQKGLTPLDIKVNVVDIDTNSIGSFSHIDRQIDYYRKFITGQIRESINTIGHEVQHAYQHAQIGRLGAGNTKYETDALMNFGPIKNINEIMEATKYKLAKESYPVKNKNADNPLYWDNYLEVNAREAGENLKKLYETNSNNEFFQRFNF